MPNADRVITIIGRDGCHLCEQARVDVDAVLAELGLAIPIVERSIADDAALHEQYWDQIPVVLIDDRVHTIWRVDADRLRAALAS